MAHERTMTKRTRTRRRSVICIVLLALFIAIAVISAVQLIGMQREYAGARQEYDSLRKYAPAPAPASSAKPVSGLAALNPDYIGWIEISGTKIDYPVVRGADNRKYLHTTFNGEDNPSGAIFMDYRCKDVFAGNVALLYGHNMKDGSMFAGLNRYMEDGYLTEHPEVTVLTLDGQTLTYRIFDIDVTDADDAAYTLPGSSGDAATEYFAAYDVLADAEQFLILSTCTNNGDDYERLLVFAALDAGY